MAATLEPACHVLGKIGQDEVGARPLDGEEDLLHDTVPVDPVPCRRRLDHGIFSADVVGRQGMKKMLSGVPQDVQIRQRGVDDDDVRTFLDDR